MIKIPEIKTDCRFFKGYIPCSPNKKHGAVCTDCKYYEKTDGKILIIKLGAAGDVIRTTPLLYPLRKEFPGARIYWLTYYTDLVPLNSDVSADYALIYNLQNVTFLSSVKFDLVINLDKDNEAICLMDKIEAKKKSGFTLKDGFCHPVNMDAEAKYLTGLFDSVSLENKKNYLEEMFEICGYEFNGEKYILDLPDPEISGENTSVLKKDGRITIGLNTGCGSRWTSRLWKNEYWIKLIKLLRSEGYRVILLGGKQEDENNKYLSSISGGEYPGYFELKEFIGIMNICDIIVSQVTMSMHIAIALGKKLVLMNNIFNKNEFELYGNGVIVEPEKECKCYFQPVCSNKDYECTDYLTPDMIFTECLKSVENIKSEIPLNEQRSKYI